MKRIAIFISALLTSLVSFSQQESPDIIREYPGQIQFSFINSYQDFNISAGLQNSSSVAYRNTVVKTGFRIRWRKLGIAASFPVFQLHPEKGSPTKNLGLTFNMFPKNLNIRGTARVVEGFEQQNGGNLLFRNDVKLSHVEMSSTYVFNPEKFSLRAPFRFFEKQLQSAGSPMLLATASYKNLSGQDSLFQISDDVLSSVLRMRVLSFGAGAGYGFTLAKGNWYLTTVATGGVELGRYSFFKNIGENVARRWQVEPVIIGQVSAGYNSDRFFAGVVSFYRPGFGSVQNLDASFYRFRAALILGIRFQQPKLFDKWSR